MPAADEFIEQARTHLVAVDEIPNTSFRKVLYLVMVDALSKVRYPKEASNRVRFVNFVREFGEWADGERVSLPQLQLVLSQPGIEPCPTLAEFLERRMPAWAEPTIHILTNNPLPDELPVGHRQTWEPCQHYSLLWEMRCTLIHEFRHPGLGHGLTESNEPIASLPPSAAGLRGSADQELRRLREVALDESTVIACARTSSGVNACRVKLSHATW